MSKERRESKIQAQREKDGERNTGLRSTSTRILDPMQEKDVDSDDVRGSVRRDKVRCLPYFCSAFCSAFNFVFIGDAGVDEACDCWREGDIRKEDQSQHERAA